MTNPHSPLSTMNPTGRFSDRVVDYAKFRPDYPRAAIEAALQGLPLDRVCVADIGAGTGISAHQFARAVGGSARVIAIEPNQAMRQSIRPHDRLSVAAGTAERTGLPAESLDLIVCAQAFHWFEPEPALAEFARVLRPGGRVALLWNERDDSDPLTAAYGRAIRVASGEHPAERRADHFAFLRDSPRFTGYRAIVFAHSQPLPGAQGLIGRAASASYVPTSGPAWDTLVATLTDVASRHAEASGTIHLRYETMLHLAERG